jgi:fatty acid desaturase
MTTFRTNEYADLKRLIRKRGLLDRQPAYYTHKVLFILSLLALGIAFFVIINNRWLQLLDAAYLAFVSTQIGFIAHDLGHRQIFDDDRKNAIVGFIFTLSIGVSREWWIGKHNRHHGNPNTVDLDPDVDIPGLAFTQEQASNKRGIERFIAKYQTYFFFPLACLLALSLRSRSIQFLLQRQGKHTATEALCMAVHFVLYFGLLAYFLTLWQAVLFVVIHQGLFGLYMASVFAPNHKGMPILDKDSQMDFIRRQVLTARNVKAHPLTDFWYGGLNYQIEHHLFPNMPRNKLKEAQTVVKAFCQAHSISYCETSMLKSYKDIMQYLREVSAVLRDGKEPKFSVKTFDRPSG